MCVCVSACACKYINYAKMWLSFLYSIIQSKWILLGIILCLTLALS